MKHTISKAAALSALILVGAPLQANASTSFIDLVNKTSQHAGVVTADFGAVALTGVAGNTGDTVFTKTGGGTTATYKDGSIYLASIGGETATPVGATGGFWSSGVTPDTQDGPGTVSFSTAVKYYGFLWGSPDGYNDVSFSILNTATNISSTVTINGAIAPLPGNGDQAFSAYLNFYAGVNEQITGVTFASTQNAFETDNHSFSVTAVPEPETYAMLLAGLGLMGTIVRRRNKSKAA